VGEEELTLMQRANELFIAGRLEEAFALWAVDGVGHPPSDWPERGPWRGRQELRRAFEGWAAAFGVDWTDHLLVRKLTDLENGRVLSEYEFAASGTESGIPVDEQLAAVYTVRDGQIVKGEFFRSRQEARAAAGLE
jgi:ketosteroid isomerase-like protein